MTRLMWIVVSALAMSAIAWIGVLSVALKEEQLQKTAVAARDRLLRSNLIHFGAFAGGLRDRRDSRMAGGVTRARCRRCP